jgi:CopG family nickel-responsive transcriptional regulator
MSLKRFGVSLEEEYLEYLDTLVKKQQFPNRSQAIRYLVNQARVKESWDGDEVVAGVIVLVYDHHKRDLQNISTDIQHDFHHLILAVQHVHLDHHHCLETISLKGRAIELKLLADRLIAIKGIKHGKLVTTMIG